MLADWYSLSHIVHGFLFYAALWLAPHWPVELALRAPRMAVEAAWEVIENTPMIIDRYREATAALGYNGDSILNSLCRYRDDGGRLSGSRASFRCGRRSRWCWCSN